MNGKQTSPAPPGMADLAAAWELGYVRGVLDEAGDLEPADNPYATTPPAPANTRAAADRGGSSETEEEN